MFRKSETLEDSFRSLMSIRRFVLMHFLQRQRDVLKRCQMREEIKGLKNGADRPPVFHQFPFPENDLTIVQVKRATVWLFQACDDAEKRRLAAARRTNQGKRVNLVQIEINILQDDLTTEGFAQVRR